MNRKPSSLPTHSPILVEALEPRIAPAGLLNESKFTSITLGTPVLLDASGNANDFQGISTGFGGNGSYLLYLTTGKALVYTTDLNGDGKFEPGEITGIALGVDSQNRAPNLLLFTDVHGDIVTNLLPGHGVSALTDSDNNPNNGRDGRILLPTDIGSITLRTINASDIDSTIPGNTVSSRLGLTSFSIYGNIYCGGNFGGLTIDNSGASALLAKFTGVTGTEQFTGATPQVGAIMTGTAVSGQSFHFTQNISNNIEGAITTFTEPAGQHGGDISNISAGNITTFYSIGTIETGTGGTGARGGDINNVTLNGVAGSYALIAGDGGTGATGGTGGSIMNFNDLGTITGQVFLHTGAGGEGTLNGGGAGGTATFATTSISAEVDIFLGNGGNGFTNGGNGSGLASAVLSAPLGTVPVGSKFLGTWHELGDVGNTHPVQNANGTVTYYPEAISFNDPGFFSDPTLQARFGDTFGDGVFTTNTPAQVGVVFGNGTGDIYDNKGVFNTQESYTVILRVPGVIDPVATVGDFNGDGRPDIAVASGDVRNFSGVYVFLNQIGTTLDPINSHNFSKNPLGDHPFSEAMQSAIPSLSGLFLVNYDPIPPLLPLVEDYRGILVGPGPVLALTSGDFNGDGIADIALSQTVPSVDGGVLGTRSVTGVLFGEAAHDLSGVAITHMVKGVVRYSGTGYFYANSAPAGAGPTLQFADGPGGNVILRATSLAVGNGIGMGTGTPPGTLAVPEVYIAGAIGADGASVYTPTSINANHQPNYPVLQSTGVAVGTVDTNRLLSSIFMTVVTREITTVTATLQDFSIVDLNNDGQADLIFLADQPQYFMTTYAGNGAGLFGSYVKGMNGTFTFVGGRPGSTNPQPIIDGDNDGIFLGLIGDYKALAGIDENGDGRFSEFGLLSNGSVAELAFRGLTTDYTIFDSFTPAVVSGTPPMVTTPEAPGVPTFNATLGLAGKEGADLTITGLDAFYINVPTGVIAAKTTGFGVISPNSTDYTETGIVFLSDTGGPQFPLGTASSRPLTENGFFLAAGNGGAARVGVGGNGGILGAMTLTTDLSGDALGALQIIFPSDAEFSGQAFLRAGDGGSGFVDGGTGGSVEGVSVVYASGTKVLTSNAVLRAGDGGNGLAGNGGGGGGIADVSVSTGVYFGSGNGGSGVNGGAGGNIVGNQTGTLFDTSSGKSVTLTADQAFAAGLNPNNLDTNIGFFGVALGTGRGGQGTNVGGVGGSITNWDSVFLNFIGGIGGSLYYGTGSGGSAAAGSGGSGGAILSSSPDANQNNLSGALHLQTGFGGTGLSGGDGGAITTFINQPTNQSAIVTLLSVITGNGGIGVNGNGGSGGAITSFQSNATGLISSSGSALSGIGKVIAGDGGDSYGGQGGFGGALSKITAQTTSTPIVVAGGAGGTGLTIGGNGGSITNSVINSAAQQIGKALIVGGVGGDALSALPADITLVGYTDPNDLALAQAVLAFGGASPHAGDGGDLTQIIQPISTQTAVDLIAGNGGSTVNSGNALESTTGVGHGGSVVDISLTGTVGAVSRNTLLGTVANPPIQDYATNISGLATVLPIKDIVDLLAQPGSPIASLVDTAGAGTFNVSGNVGIVAGAAGRLRNDQPARDSVNGSAQNILAESVMSIVAGSVSRVAPVNVLSNITVTDPNGVLGADRTPVPLPADGTADGGPNGRLDYNLPGATPGVTPTVANLTAGYSLVDADGALFAITIESASGTVLQGPRIFPVLPNT